MQSDDPVLVGRTWHFADGATVPLVSGGSDGGGEYDGGGDAPAPVEAAAPAAAAPTSNPGGPFAGLPPLNPADTSPAADADLLEGDLEGEVFTKEYLTRVRTEAAKARVAGNTLADRYAPLEQMDEQSRDVMIGLARAFSSEDQDTIADGLSTMAAILEHYGYTPAQAAAAAEGIADQAAPAGQDAPIPPDPYDDDFSTKMATYTSDVADRAAERAIAAFRAQIAEEQAAQQRQRDVDDIVDQATRLSGFAAGSAEHTAILGIAAGDPRADVAAAHAQWQQIEQGIVQRYLEAKAQQPGAVTAPPGGAPPNPTMNDPRNFKTFAEADRAMQEHLSRMGM